MSEGHRDTPGDHELGPIRGDVPPFAEETERAGRNQDAAEEIRAEIRMGVIGSREIDGVEMPSHAPSDVRADPRRWVEMVHDVEIRIEVVDTPARPVHHSGLQV